MLQTISQTDLFSAWIDKLNAAINALNTINPTNVFGLSSPANNDLLVYNSGTGLFTNQAAATFTAAVLVANANLITNNVLNYFLQNQQTVF